MSEKLFDSTLRCCSYKGARGRVDYRKICAFRFFQAFEKTLFDFTGVVHIAEGNFFLKRTQEVVGKFCYLYHHVGTYVKS